MRVCVVWGCEAGKPRAQGLGLGFTGAFGLDGLMPHSSLRLMFGFGAGCGVRQGPSWFRSCACASALLCGDHTVRFCRLGLAMATA